MKQIILCIGCAKVSGCRIKGVEKLCSGCKSVANCDLLSVEEPATESFVTCGSCAKRFDGDYD
ncbi:MAG: hypothetical protein WC823_00150 [Parcubacteria group bacterium]